MKTLIILLATLLLAEGLFSQQRITIDVEKSKINLLEEMKLKDQFLDNQFYSGKVTFINGKSSSAYLNYNIVANAIIFLDEEKKAFFLEDLPNVRMVTYGKRAFVPISAKEVAEVVETFSNGASLLLHRHATVKNSHDFRGAYGTSSEMAFSDRYISIQSGGVYTRFDNSVVAEVSLMSSYIFYKDGKRIPIRKFKDLKKLNPAKWDEVLKFAQSNYLSMDNPEDIVAAIRFCIQ